MFDTPVAIAVFNRPEPTRRLMSILSRVRPRRLFIIADGPRPNHPEDETLCRETLAAVAQIDWEASIERCFSEVNLGCGPRMSSGISWVFERVDRAIILEDDCLPSASFFPFCESLLERYQDDRRIGLISGTNHAGPMPRETENASYFFSRYPMIWGWATWRRIWEKYDFEMRGLEQAIRSGCLQSVFKKKHVFRYWERHFLLVHNGLFDTWDYQLFFASFLHSWLNVNPTRNLVENVGFGMDATHTKYPRPPTYRKAQEISFPLRHPDTVARDDEADILIEKRFWGVYDLRLHLAKKLKRFYWRLRSL